MDVSLDDYINTSNFKIKIGNPGFKGTKPQGGGAFQQGKKRFANVNPGNRVTDVSVTVTGVPKTAVKKVNITNQVRDARERLVSKPGVADARQKISQKAPADARQKLQTIRARKGPVDARARIQAKKQQPGGTAASTSTAQESFTLTRTVTNSNNVQINRSASNSMQITRTLTKVMPPGYEALVGEIATPAPVAPPKPQSGGVKLRLGPPQQGRQGNTPTLTRTVSNTNAQRHPPASSPAQNRPEPWYEQFSPQDPLPQRQYQTIRTETRPPRMHAPVPQMYPPPPPATQMYPPYPPQAPPPAVQVQPRNFAPLPQAAPNEGPPYPVVDLVMAPPQVIPQHTEAPLPRIQVQNDQYRPPPPVQPYPQYSRPAPEPPQYVYTPPPRSPQPSYYPPAQQDPEPRIQRTVPNVDRVDPAPPPQYVKTVRNDYEQERSEQQAMKRKAAPPSGGPLKLSSTNTVPVLDVGDRRPQGDRDRGSGYYKLTKEEPPAKKLREDTDENVISPLQGYKIVITNLAVTVTQDDIIELFAAIGAVKKVKLVKPGTAEVVYVSREHAIEATKIYHERELDGQPMVVKMVTSVSAKVREAPEALPPQMKPAATGPLKLSRKPAGMAKVSDKKSVEVDVLHKALFKTGSTSQSKPVTFTVNI